MEGKDKDASLTLGMSGYLGVYIPVPVFIFILVMPKDPSQDQDLIVLGAHKNTFMVHTLIALLLDKWLYSEIPVCIPRPHSCTQMEGSIHPDDSQ